MQDGFPQRVAHLFGRVLTAAPGERAALLAAHREREPDVVRRVEWMLADRESETPTRVVNAPSMAPASRRGAGGAGDETSAFDADGVAPTSRPDVVAPASRRCPAAPADDSAPLDAGAAPRDAAAPPAPRDAATASNVFPGYEIVRRLSQGGQGVVYQAVETATKRKVALKVLLEGVHASKSARRRFEREIEIVAQFRHPHIIGVLHAGQSGDGRQFYAMDYVRGELLTTFVRSKKLPLDAALELFATLCDAVQYAHQRGIIHRDLKPSNVLVDTEGRLRVLDFGLAKSLGATDQTLISLTGQAVGTLAYMSPEQTRGNPDEIDTRADVYALGVMLYEILVGQFPYPVTGSIAEVLKHIASTPPTPPSRNWKADSGVAVRPSSRAGRCPIDADLETIVLKALSKERDRRYPGAGDLARDVRHYLAGEPIEARRDSALYVLRKTLGRYRLAAGVAAAFVVMAVGFGVVMAVQARQLAHERDKALAAEREQTRLREVAESEQRKAQTEAAVANFRQAQARREVNEALVDRAERYVALRRAHDLAHLAPPEAQADYPAKTFAGAEAWLKRKLPEWFASQEEINKGGVEGVTPIPGDIRKLASTAQIAPDDPLHQPLYDWLATHEGRIEQIVAETGRRQFNFGYLLIRNPYQAFWEVLLPAMNSGRELSGLLAAHAALQHVARQDAHAVEALAAARRATRLIAQSNTLISLLVECSIRNKLNQCAATFATDAAARGDDPSPFLRYMAADPPLLPLGPFLQSELTAIKQSVAEAFAPPTPGARARLQEKPLRAWFATFRMGEEGEEQVVAALMEKADSIELEDTLRALQRVAEVYATVDQLPIGRLETYDHDLLQAAADDPFTQASLPPVRRAIQLVQKCRADRDAAIVAVALAVFRHAHGRWPDSVEEALEESPLRRTETSYFGQPFKYRLDAGFPLLYSVGENGVDDGGSLETDDVYVMPPELRTRAIKRLRQAPPTP